MDEINVYEIYDRDLHTILAALRMYQNRINDIPERFLEIATNYGEVDPLTADEIDDLCEELNRQSPYV